MANTSPCHMSVLGNVPPLKSRILIFFRDVISLLDIFILIDRATQQVHINLKEIVGPIFEIRH